MSMTTLDDANGKLVALAAASSCGIEQGNLRPGSTALPEESSLEIATGASCWKFDEHCAGTERLIIFRSISRPARCYSDLSAS